MPLSTLPELMQALAACRLLSPEQIQAVQAGGGTTPGQVLQNLVQQGWLTRWQAERLLAGQSGFYFGKYLLLDQLGAGGMGTVFRARQTGMDRIVALKVMSRKLIRDVQSLARFQREVEAAAALAHPNIVLALDADSRQGVPYLVMEFVAGDDLRSPLQKQGRLPIGLASEYARQTALGLQHAYERGMVHRDIKPANLLLTRTRDGRPLVKILDFGLARFQSEVRETGEITRTGEIMGTPDYISPEQASDTRSADIRSDIYSLGCTLYHWLSGSVPFPGHSLMERLMARATRDPRPLAELRPETPPELAKIVQKMLARDPAKRYQTPDEVAAALAPFCVTAAVTANVAPVAKLVEVSSSATQELPTAPALEGELQQFLAVLDAEATLPGGTIETQGAISREPPETSTKDAPPSRVQRNLAQHAKTDRRQGVIAAVIVGLVAVLVGSYALWQRGNQTTLVIDWPLDQRTGATLAVDGREIRLPPTEHIVFSGPVGRRTLRLTRTGYEPIDFEKTLGRGVRESVPLDWQPNTATRRAALWDTIAEKWPQADNTSDSATERSAQSTAVRTELIEFQRQHRGSKEAVVAATKARSLPWPIDSLSATTPDADRTQPHIVGVLGDPRWKYLRNHVTAVAFDATGKYVLASGPDRQLSLWDVATGLRVRRFDFLENYPLACIERTPDPERLLIGTTSGLIAKITMSSVEPVWQTKWNHGLTGFVAASQDGRSVVAGSFNGSLKRLNPDDGTVVKSLMPDQSHLMGLAVSPSGRLTAAARGGKLLVWDSPEAEVPLELAETGNYVSEMNVQFTADERWLACPRSDQMLAVWDTATWERQELTDKLQTVVFDAHPSKPWLAVALWGGTTREVRVIDLSQNGATLFKSDPLTIPATALAWNVEGTQLAVGDRVGNIRLWTPGAASNTAWHNERLTAFVIAPDGSTITAGNYTGDIIQWQLDTLQEATRWDGNNEGVSNLAISHDGRLLATSHLDFVNQWGRRTLIWDVHERRVKQETAELQTFVMSSAFSPDDRLLAAGMFDGTTHLYDVATGKERHVLPGSEQSRFEVYSVAFHPQGKLLATGYWIWEKPVRLWDLSTTPVSEKRWLTGHTHNVRSVAFSPLGDLLITGSLDETVRLWNPNTGKQEDYLPSHLGGVYSVAASPDGQWIAVAEGSGYVSLWPLVGKRVVPTHRVRVAPYEEPVMQVQFTPDSRHLLALIDNGTIAVVRIAEWTPKPVP